MPSLGPRLAALRGGCSSPTPKSSETLSRLGLCDPARLPIFPLGWLFLLPPPWEPWGSQTSALFSEHPQGPSASTWPSNSVSPPGAPGFPVPVSCWRPSSGRRQLLSRGSCTSFRAVGGLSPQAADPSLSHGHSQPVSTFWQLTLHSAPGSDDFSPPPLPFCGLGHHLRLPSSPPCCIR